MSADTHLTLASESEGVIREKASKFLAYAFPIADEAAFRTRCDALAKEHHTSRHVCYAWVLGDDGERSRVHDAGEPSGTAGKPILRQLQGASLTFSAIIVVRYFGGTLLGKAGLVHAYADAARDALRNAVIREHVLLHALTVTCTYTQAEGIKREVMAAGGHIAEATYAESCVLDVRVPRSVSNANAQRWTNEGMQVLRDQLK